MRLMIKKILSVTSCTLLLCIIACSENTAGVTEEENPGIAFAVKEPASYDLWSFDSGVTNSKNTGYWFGLDDSDEESAATITFPVSIGDSTMKDVIDACGGLCGTVEFMESSKPQLSAGIGFSLGKDNSTVDASSWKGLCVTYESDLDMHLTFSSGKDAASVDGDMPFVEFPKEIKVATRCAKWEDFKQARLNNVSGEEAAKKLGALLFEFLGKSKQKGSFNIKGLGSYKNVQSQQNGESKKPKSSSSVSSSSVSSSSISSSSVSSSSIVINKCADLWDGTSGDIRIETKMNNNTETAGYWLTLEDSENTKLIWPVALGNDYSVDAMDPVIEHCGGVCGVAEFDSSGYAGVGFNIVGQTSDADPSPMAGDITEWGGLCVTYSSQLDMDIVMNDNMSLDILDLPKVVLPKSSDDTTKCVSWDEFVASSGTPGDPSKVLSIIFVFNGKGGSYSQFNIRKLGRLRSDECPMGQNSSPKVVSSSSAKVSSSSGGVTGSFVMNGNSSFDDVCSFETTDDMWYGPDGAEMVETRLANDTETAGYWFSIDGQDSAGNPGAVFEWPVPRGNEFSELSFYPIIEYCAGLCGQMYFKANAFAGVGFNVVGETSIENKAPVAGDVSRWAGLCVTYAADVDMDVVMIDSAENLSIDQIPSQPKVTLSKSIDVTTKCMEWHEFVSTTGKSEVSSHLTSLLFMFHGENAKYYRFNIMGVGQFRRLSNPECTAKEHFVSGE